MRCRQCDYSLWTIQRRECPECGAPFRPSEFQFQRGSVAFRCPHCRQDYYGTSPEGHLEPREFDCVGCGQHIAMDEMVLEPAAGVGMDDESTTAVPNPWIERVRIGRVKAWFQSVVKILGDPRGFAGSLRPGAPSGDAWRFFAWCVAVQVVLSLVCAAPSAIVLATGGFGSAGTGRMRAGSLAWTLIWPAVSPVVYHFLFVMLATAWMHGVLRVCQAATYPIGRTNQIALYAEGAATALAGIPCVNIIARLWWCVSAAFMLQRAQRCHWAVSALATVPGVLAALVLVSLFSIAPMMGMFGPRGMAAIWRAGSPALVGNNWMQSGLGPDLATALLKNVPTPLDAVADGFVQGDDLMQAIAPDGTTAGVGEVTQAAILLGAASQVVRDEGARLAARLPPSPQPYRIGQAIFCYRGVPIAPLNPDPTARALWLVISMSRDPAGSVTVHSSEGARTFARSQFAGELAAENKRRSGLGLPALPDPSTVPDVYSGFVPIDVPATDATPPSQ